MVVAIASALFMIISKYGFADMVNIKSIALDPSRIAAQIVSGISFIGAGTILVRKDQVSGLTTAAGVWATSAIGMAEGAGLYSIGIAATFLLVVIQFVFHDDYFINKLFKHIRVQLQIVIIQQPAAINDIKHFLQKYSTEKIRVRIISVTEKKIVFNADFIIANKNERNQIMLELQQNKNVLQISSLTPRY
ncbi:Mg2+ transporter [Liquorilactobacillus vini DSM 20605]|uniref:Mg2+ transporter n=2 Tax=Liquorilactobacillus vini TaxID=238015 RepID=A0A0R2C3R7_9LACO|nr:Mg2+ transporter [Liquorilactobacillus vini DSM 20605]